MLDQYRADALVADSTKLIRKEIMPSRATEPSQRHLDTTLSVISLAKHVDQQDLKFNMNTMEV